MNMGVRRIPGMMETEQTIEVLRQKDIAHLIHPNTVLRDHEATGPLIIVRGEGSTVYDIEGHALIDGLSGLWNCMLGHGRKDIIRAVSDQMERIAFATTFSGVSNDTTIEWAAGLAKRLPGDLHHLFPNVTGSEADDTALKFTRMYFSLSGRATKLKVFSHHRGYHGVASGVLSATGVTDFWKRYLPLQPYHLHVPTPNCYRCPYGKEYPACDTLCATVLEQMILAEDPDTVAAFIAEPVLGSAGVVIPKPDYYRRVRQICDKYNILFIDDEIITGFGRTGKWFGIEHWGVVPDIMTMGKGMTAGYLPMFATAVSQRIYQAFVDSGEMLYHGFTYTGQPALSAAALKVMEILETENLIQRVNEVGRVFAQKSQELLEYPWVGEVRNIGMLGGIEFVADKKTKAQFGPEKKFIPRFTMALRKQGVLSRVVRGDTLVLAPPFVITEAEMDELFRGIRGAIEEVCPTV
jgi:putrescine aminotransferase